MAQGGWLRRFSAPLANSLRETGPNQPLQHPPTLEDGDPMRDMRPLFWISLAIFVWSLILAAGVWLFAGDDANRWWRPLIVILFVDGFLGLWLLALFVRQRGQRD